jgi:uncharacterized protein YutE (UPF0331/DUF86 family)
MPIDPDHLKQRIDEVLEAKSELTRLTLKPYTKLNLEEKYAIRYHIIVLAEAQGNMCIQIATEDLKQEPQSCSECFKIMQEKKVRDCAKDLTAIMRLRNLLAHRYWTIDDRQVYDSIKNNFKAADQFLKSVKTKYAINL